MKVERISARVANARNSVRFYRDVLGMEIIYGERRWMFFFAPGQGRQRPDPEFRAGASS
jgi:catechol 2,3-dioxygenase-like lactoylglutathione lyase family enzyme